MLHSQWLFLAYGLLLVVAAFRPERIGVPDNFRLAVRLYVCVLFVDAFFLVLRAANLGDPKDLMVIEIWAEIIGLVVMGVSLLMFFAALEPRRAAPVDRPTGGFPVQ